MHVDHNTTKIGAKNLDINSLNFDDMESDLGMPMLREIVYDENGILK